MAVTISEATWNELLNEARAAIDRWNSRCTGNYARYSHELKVTDCGASVLAEAIQHDASSTYSGPRINRLGWRKGDGAVMKVAVKYGQRLWHGTRQYTISGQPVVAKTWEKAAAKSVTRLLDVSKLVDFFMLGEVRVTQGPTLGVRP